MSKIPAFCIHYNIWVECDGFETEGEESFDQARIALSQELREGFKQTAYDITWEIETSKIEELPKEVEVA